MSKHDYISLLICAIFIVIAFLITNNPDWYGNMSKVNAVSIWGAMASITGAIIAVIQIHKIQSSNQTFVSTLNKIENERVLELISQSLAYVKLIKSKLESENPKSAVNSMNDLQTNLGDIVSNKNIGENESTLSNLIGLCASAELDLFTNDPPTQENVSAAYQRMGEINTSLTSIRARIRSINNNEL